jgi:hypothetical protein
MGEAKRRGATGQPMMRLMHRQVIRQLEEEWTFNFSNAGFKRSCLGDTHALLISRMKNAEKIIFDSGTDHEQLITTAYRETALEMMNHGLFRLPFDSIWVEDYFEDAPDHRMCYFAEEVGGRIAIYAMFVIDSMVMEFYDVVAEIDIRNPAHDAIVDRRRIPLGIREESPVVIKATEAVYSLKKLLVTLATKQAIEERVTPPRAPNAPRERRADDSPYLLVRTPLDEQLSSSMTVGGRTTPRKHLVSGYVWGKNTKPRNQQRWIKPFFRGSGELRPRIVEVRA